MLTRMRHRHYHLDADAGLALIDRCAVLQLATTTPEGAPVLRALHAVRYERWIAFHGARTGEKTRCLGRPAVVSAQEIVAEIPSYFIDPERACPATTYYRAVQVHGPLESLEAPADKAAVLCRIMQKYQPEGGYTPIDSAHPLYERAVAGVLVFGVRLDRVEAKAKLGQNRSPEELVRIVNGLWQRGQAGDARAIRAILSAHPALPAPEFLRGPDGTTLCPALDTSDLPDALRLVQDEYWNRDLTPEKVGRAHLGSNVWVGARASDGALVGTARAVSDGEKFAYLADIAVAPERRGRGIGQALVRLLLDHPQVRRAWRVMLRTADAHELYRKFGFRGEGELELPYPSSTMVRSSDSR